MSPPPTPTPRVSRIPLPERYDLPGRPEGSPPAAQDAYRQTCLLLAEDLALFAEGMNLQLRIIADSRPSRYRTHELAAVAGLWSRAFLCLADGCALLTRGSYPSCPPLVRTACEGIAAQRLLLSAEMDQFLEWLGGHLRPHKGFRALDVGLGHYFAGEAIATDERLGLVYRPAADFSRPNFGATLLQVGPDSSGQRLALAFADSSFHAGWAELIMGWLLALCERQAAVAVGAPHVFAASFEAASAHADLARRIDEAVAKPSRCRVEEVHEENERRYLMHNFRRAAGGAPKKMLL